MPKYLGLRDPLRALRVHQTASARLQTGVLQAEPPWYRVVAEYPPSTTLVRTLPIAQPKKPRSTAKGSRLEAVIDHGRQGLKKRSSSLYKPQKIWYPEDAIREWFFKDHPWELARPRILVENTGNDGKDYDWSKLMQKNKQLDGESVVQRTLYMMEVEGRNSKDAYDIARKEFYRLRMKQDIERRIAREEAIAVGANFGLSYMEISLENEGKIIDQWRNEAIADFNLRMNKKASAISDSGESEEADVEEAVPLASVFGR